MRLRSLRSLRISVACTLVGLAAYSTQACTDDESAPATPGIDSGLDAPASTEGGPITPAEGGVDATIDAPAVGPVTIVVVDSLAIPIAGAKVAFYDGANVTVVATGSDGRATHVMGTGDVTVAENRDSARHLTTYVGVEPNDVITVLGGLPNEPPLELAFATVTFDTVATYAGATDYQITAGCRSVFRDMNSFVPLEVPASCVKQDKVPLLAIARNAGGNIVAFAVKEATVTDGGTTNVDIAGGDWKPSEVRSIDFAGTAPAHVSFTGHEVSFHKNGFELYREISQPPINAFDLIPTIVPPAGYPELVRSFTTIGFEYGPDGGVVSSLLPRSVLLKQEPLPAGDGGIGRTFGDFLPRIHTIDFDSGTSQAASWQTDAPMSGVGGYLYLTGSVTIDGAAETVEWRAVFPPGSSVAIPALPAELADFQPLPPLNLQNLALVDSPEIGSYKAFRAVAGKYFFLHGYDDTVAVPGAAPLTARVTSLEQAD